MTTVAFKGPSDSSAGKGAMRCKGLIKGSKDSRTAGSHAPFVPQIPHFESVGDVVQENCMWNAPRLCQVCQNKQERGHKLDINRTNRTSIFNRGTRHESAKPAEWKLGNGKQDSHRREAEGAEMDNLVWNIGESAGSVQRLARLAARQYAARVDAITKVRIRNSRRI